MLKYILIFVVLFTSGAISQKIPSDRIVEWSKAGTEYEVDRTKYTMLNAIDLGLKNDASSDNSKLLNQIIRDRKDSIIIVFKAGRYLFNSTVTLRSGVILKGDGADATSFVFDLGKSATDCIDITGSVAPIEFIVDSGYTFNSDELYVREGMNIKPGAFIEFYQTNGAWDVVPADWAKNSVGQILKIIKYEKNKITLNQKLRIGFSATLNPRFRVISPIVNSGIECIKINRLDEPATGAGYNILFNYANNCFIQGIISDKSVGSHIMIDASSNCSVKDSYITDAFTFDGSGTRGYGVTLNNKSGLNLIENNIFKKLRHAMMTKHGANGNVFAYNFSTEVKRSEPISNFGGDISLHGHYSFANLFEGNVVQSIIIDSYWGPSGPLNTFHRNRCLGYGILITTGSSAEVPTDKQNFIANEVDYSGLLLGPFSLSGKDHFAYGNNIDGTIKPNSSDKPDITSLYYAAKPEFFTQNDKSPLIGYPNQFCEYKNPAMRRYENANGFALCQRALTNVQIIEKKSIIKCLTNGVLHLNECPESTILLVYDLRGRIVSRIFNPAETTDFNYLPSGIYSIIVSYGVNINEYYKFIIIK